MTTDDRRFEGSEYEQVKYKFNQLIEFGKDFGNALIKGKKGKSKAISNSLNTPHAYNSDIRAKKLVQESASKENMKDFIQQIFQHYDVNPSRDGYNEKIINTYVNSNLSVIEYLKKEHDYTANEGDSFYKEVNSLIQRIKTKDDINQEERKFFIVGIRGSGKTSFINYFISKYEEDLNKNNVVSIRINVSRIYNDVSLEDAIKFKTCRILLTYYCTLQEHNRLINRDIKDSIDKYLLYIINNNEYNFSENDVKKCIDYFKNYEAKETKKIPDEHYDLCKLLLKLVVNDYKFIIILDNFDQVTPKDKENYEKRMQELNCISSSVFFNHSVYIIAVRYSTFNTLPVEIRKAKRSRVIGTPTTFDMFNKRIDYFSTISGSLRDEKKINCFKNLIVLIGNSFMPDTNHPNKFIDFQQTCDSFDDIFYGNKRLIINMIDRFINIIPQDDFESLCEQNYEIQYGNIFDRLVSQTYYKFLESLLININTGYCNCFFEYKKENEKYQFSSINATAHFDENFLPNLYRSPTISNIKDVQFTPFLKIRILQLLVNYNNNNDDKLRQNDIAGKLRDIFGYSTDAVHLACEELRWDQSIIIIEKEPEDDDKHKEDIRTRALDITPRGEKLLDILPTNINLLAVSLEQMFFPISFLKTGIFIGNYNDTDISKFIIRNIFFSLPKTIGLLNSIEQYEKNVLLSRNTTTNQKYFNVDSDFAITEKLKELSNKSIERIYFSYFKHEHNEDEKYIKRRADLKEQLGI